MKKTLKFVPLAICLGLLLIGSCKPDEPTAKEVFIKNLSRKWKPSTTGVTFNGQTVNGVFDAFTVTFAKGLTYSTSDGQDPVWRGTGKFTLQKKETAAGFAILRDDGVEITVEAISDSKLILKFPFEKKTGRVSSVSGGYVFDLIPG